MKTLETRKLISEMRNKDIEMKKEKLEYIGRTIPYGYLKENKNLIIDKITAPIVYLIYDLFDKGLSHTAIADYLNERNIVSPSYYKICNKYINIINNDESKKWKRGAIRKILLNKVYNGYYKYSNIKTHPEIIDDELFNRVQSRIKDKQNTSGSDFYYHNGNIFSNKAYCSECGRVLTLLPSYTKEGIVNYLRCSSNDTRRDKKVCCCNKAVIRYEELKEIVSLFVENEIYTKIDLKKLEKLYESSLKDESINNHRKYLKMERDYLKQELSEISNQYVKGEDLIAEIRNKEKMELIKLYNRRLDEIEELLKEIYSFARTKSISNNELCLDKYVIDSFIDRITIGTLNGFNRSIEILLK